MTDADNIEKKIERMNFKGSAEMHNRILGDALQAQAGVKSDIWRMIMKSKITKLAPAAVIIIAVLIGINQFSGSIDGSNVAWAELIERVERSHDEYYTELLLAMEAKDVEKVSSRADALSEFWQGLNMVAEEGLESTEDSLSMLKHESFYNRFQEFEKQIFIVYAENFITWMDKIEDTAWINEIAHVCRQLEEYAEEIREPGRHPELEFSYAEHCLPSFIAYCDWFEQLPWENPEQVMTPTMLLTAIQRDLEIARWEIETLEIRGVIPFIKRCVHQAQKNILDLDIKTAPIRTKKQRELCRHLTRRIDELCALVIYAEVTRQDLIEQLINQNHQFNNGERYDQVLTEDFGNKGPFADYYVERIDQSLDLCEQLLSEFENVQLSSYK
ncbi:MAG: hypothetical protein ACYSSP_01065 [Planctomycetota bacterium]|jgi:hypothetical protein